MSFLFLLLTIWLYKIQRNPKLLQLICRELEGHYNPLRKDNMEEAMLLYQCMLVTGESFGVCQCSGWVTTPFGVFEHCNWEMSSRILFSHSRDFNIHLSQSKQLRCMLFLISLSSSMLLPRLFAGFDGRFNTSYFSALILSRMMKKLQIPDLKVEKYFFCKIPPIRHSGLITCCYLQPPSVKNAGWMTPYGHFKYQNNHLNNEVRDFLKSNPDFILNFKELIDLIFWAFMQQDALKAQDAANVGLPSSAVDEKRWVRMEPRKILDEANQGMLLNRALSLASDNKMKQLAQIRIEERDEQVRCILVSIVEGAMHSSDAARVPAPAPAAKPSEYNQQDAEPYD